VSEVEDRKKKDPKDIPFPNHLLIAKPPYRPGVKRVAVDRFFKQEYHDLEVEKIWKKTWQWACREEEIPDVGDHYLYEIAEMSFIIMRTAENEFKAYWNSCPHRARRIRDHSGKRATELRCMFHGWAWNIDGTMKDMNCGWDFPGTRDEVSKLREAKVGVWAGFVMINPDPNCESLEDFMGEMPEHYAALGCDFDKRWVQVHVVAELNCNWKVAQEAFIEPWHVMATHPQLLSPPTKEKGGGERWDDFGNWMRNAPATPADNPQPPPGWGQPAESDQQYVDAHFDHHLNEVSHINVAETGKTGWEIVSEHSREEARKIIGDKVDEYHDFHLSGYEMVHLFPNFHPWGGWSRLIYRFRPYKSETTKCLMDVLIMSPWPEDKPRPPPAPEHRLQFGQPITDAPELGNLGRIFLQDLGNLEAVQAGLKISPQGYVILGIHNESPVRHLHDLYDKWMGFEDGDYLSEKKP
jgi:phenylpropionate dioxygenase-like ring-hydroxylating dioxygenase large terminal subunit